MTDIQELVLTPENAFDASLLQLALDNLATQKYKGRPLQVLKRSVDARGKNIHVRVLAGLKPNIEDTLHSNFNKNELPDVSNAPSVCIIGAGPAGIFAALECIANGIKPIILERGKDVRERRRDLATINKYQTVNPESNYCFGEGGAGTYSDGKLYTRSKKRGDINHVLKIFVSHGAPTDILIDAHPHIGTNKLPALVASLRETIIKHGGEVHFNTKVIGFINSENTLKGIKLESGSIITAEAYILATGHSARDVFEQLQEAGITIEAKPFAIGVRAEHQQSIIDKAQYRLDDRGMFLPAASYSLVHQVPFESIDKGVFSFCMCPGGFIVPSATAQQEVVVNGMSPSRRDSAFANSGIVVAVDQEQYGHLIPKFGALAGLEFQTRIEAKAWEAGGKTQIAPAQKLADFVAKRATSSAFQKCSYQPGLQSTNLYDLLPDSISNRLAKAFVNFGNKIKGFHSNDAVLLGVESRTSSPIKIPRDKETFQHIHIDNLYPCGEGAGYAGGIMSAALDGQNVARAIAIKLGKTVKDRN